MTNAIRTIVLFALTNWHREVLKAIGKVLGNESWWRILDAAEAVQCLGGGNRRIGVEWNPEAGTATACDGEWEAVFSASGIAGQCRYGSEVKIAENEVFIATCGGHWVRVSRTMFPVGHRRTRWMTDTTPSEYAWGDWDDVGEEPAGVVVAHRRQALQRAHINVIKKARQTMAG